MNSSTASALNLTDDQLPAYVLTTKYVSLYALLPVLCLLGILGNSISLCVLTRREMTSSTTTYLKGLAVSDLLLVSLFLPRLVLMMTSTRGSGSPSFQTFFTVLSAVHYVTHRMFATTTSWLTVAVAVDRFISLRFISRARSICTVRRARRVCIGIFLTSFTLHYVYFLEIMPGAGLSREHPFLKAMKAINLFLSLLIPFLLLVVINSFLVRHLVIHRRRMQHLFSAPSKPNIPLENIEANTESENKTDTDSSPATSKPDDSSGGGSDMSFPRPASTRSRVNNSRGFSSVRRVTVIVVATALSLLTCYSLELVTNMVYMFGQPSRPNIYFFTYVSMVLAMVNSSLNFLLYCAIGTKFRKVLVQVLLEWQTKWNKLKNRGVA